MKQGTLLTKIVMAILFVAIVVYIIAVAIYNAMNPFKWETAIAAVSDDGRSVSAWIFRDEVCLPSATGLIDLRLDEGDKVAANKTLAAVYQSQEALDRQQELREISSQVTQLTYATAEERTLSSSALDSELTNQIAQLRMEAASGDYASLSEQTDTFKQLVLRREYLTASDDDGTRATMLQTCKVLEDEQTALVSAAQGEYSEIVSTSAGYYSSHSDGYETLFPTAALEGVTAGNFRTIIQQTPLQTDPSSLGKVVTSGQWKMAFFVPEEDAGLYRTGANVEVRLASSTNTLGMKVAHVSLPEKEECVVVLVANENLKTVLSLRNVSCSVIFDKQEGILISKEALRVLDKAGFPKDYAKVEADSLTGVFTVTGLQAEFKPVKVLAETEDGYIVEANPQTEKDERILRSGDEVVIAATDLYDGKVVR